MAKKHLKALNVPVSWPITRKGQKFIIRPNPGKVWKQSIPLSLVLKILLKYTKTMKETKTLLKDKEVFVDGVRRKDPKYNVGLMDIVSIPLTGENYRMVIDKNGKLGLLGIENSAASHKICKITRKKMVKGGNIHYGLHDGRSLIMKKDIAKIGDSLVLELPSQKVKEVLRLEKGAHSFMIDGKHVGEFGTIESISGETIGIKSKDGKFSTPAKFVFVIGTDEKVKNE